MENGDPAVLIIYNIPWTRVQPIESLPVAESLMASDPKNSKNGIYAVVKIGYLSYDKVVHTKDASSIIGRTYLQ